MAVRTGFSIATILILSVAVIPTAALASTCEGMNGAPGDVDGDGFLPPGDCDPADPGLWSEPGAVSSLRFEDKSTIVWDSAQDLGGTRQGSYNLYRAPTPNLSDDDCFVPDVELPESFDAEVPAAGTVHYYLAQARNDCGGGGVGSDSSGDPRPPLSCDCSVLCDDGDVCTRDICSNGTCENALVGPTIHAGPHSGSACAGPDAVSFRVSATGNGPLSYQWLQDGNPVGTDAPVLTLSTASCASGQCQVVVVISDGCSSTTSEEATLSVFSDPASCAGGLNGYEIPFLSGPGRRARIETEEVLSFSRKAGDVHLHSGEYTRREVDLVVPGRGLDFVWSRVYRSREVLPADSVQGRQWMHGYDRRVEPDPNVPENLLLLDGSRGRVDSFSPSPALPDCWERPGFFQHICRQPDNRFVLTFADKERWIFQPLDGAPAQGRIEAAVDRNNNAMQFLYDPVDGRLDGIVDTLGRPYQLVYDPNGLLEALVDFTGRQCTYDYYGPGDPGGSPADLKSVTTPAVVGTPTGNDFPDGKTTVYTYSSGFVDDRLNHNLLTVTDPEGHTFMSCLYAPTDSPADARFDRLDRIALPDGTISYLYVIEPPDPLLPQIAATTIVNDRAGNVAHYDYDADNRLLRARRFTGRADPALPTDAATNRPTAPLRATDPPFFETLYQYNGEHMPTFVQFPNGNSLQLQYDPLNPDPRFRGNLQVRTWNPGPLGGDPPLIVESWGHDSDFGTRYDARVSGQRSAPRYSWRQTRGPFRFTTRTGELFADFSDPDTAGSCGDEAAFDYVWRLAGVPDQRMETVTHDVCKTPTPGGPVPIPYPNMASGCAAVPRPRKATRGENYRSFATSYTDGRGLTYQYTYDAAGNLREAEAPAVVTGTPGGVPQSVVEQFDYNASGQPTRHTSAAGRVDEFAYHSAGPQTGYLRDRVVDAPGLALTTTYEYDVLGNVTRITDPRGNSTEYVRNQRNQIVRVIDSAPRLYETDLYYDDNDLLVRVDVENQDEQGNPEPNAYLTTLYDYDSIDRRVREASEVDNDGVCVVEELEYDANGNPALRRMGEATAGNDPGNVVRRLYDERDLLFRETRGEGISDASTTQYDYDGNGNKSVVREGLEDPSGTQDAIHEYDGYDRLVRTIDPLGNTGERTFDANDTVLRLQIAGEELQGAGLPPVVLYAIDLVPDELNRIVRAEEEHFFAGTPPTAIGDGRNTTEWFYDPDSRLVRFTDDRDHSTDVQYDSARRVEIVTDALGNSETYTYDPNSNIIRIDQEDLSDLGSPPELFATTYEYDSLDRRIRVTDNAGSEWELQYDSRDNVRVHVDALDNVTRFRYDGIDRLLESSQEKTDTGTGAGTVVDTVETRYCRDDSSRTTCRIDDNGNRTEYAYDALDRLVEIRHPDGTSHSIVWDVQDNPVERHDANGTVRLQDYDALDRLVTRTILPAPGVGGTTLETFAWDGLSRLRSATDDDSSVGLRYDSLSNVVEESLQLGGAPVRLVTSTHDGVGNTTSVTYPSGDFVQMSYDALDRLSQVLSGGALVAGYDYIGRYRVERDSGALGYATEFTYDARRNVTRTLHTGGPGLDIDEHTFAHDAMYNRTLRHDQRPGGRLQEWEYDSLYRVARSHVTVAGTTTIDYELDGPGNRLLVSGGPDAGPYTLDPALPSPGDFQLNQYTSTPLDTREYDANGNLVSRTSVTGAETFVYDFDNRMTAVTGPGGITHEYDYDALGRRIQKVDTSTGETTRYYYDGWHVVEEQDGTDSMTRVHIYGASVDELLESREGQDVDGNGGLDRYVFFFSEGHVSTVLDGLSGDVVERYDYDDFGRPQFFDSLGNSLPQSTIRNPYLFGGRRYDEETGFYYFRNRYLDPAAGRFTTRDPVGVWGDASHLGNAYSFAANSPWTYDDPYGLMNKSELIEKIASKDTLAKAAAERAFDAVIRAMRKTVKKGDKISLVGFGSFSISRRAARTGRNPQTGKEMKIPLTGCGVTTGSLQEGGLLWDSVKPYDWP